MQHVIRACLCVCFLLPVAAAANEAAVRKAMQKHFPDMPVERVTKTPMPGIYEVYAGGQILYVDENVNYLIVSGRMIDLARKANLTEERMRLLTAVKFDDLPLDLAFRMVRGNGKRRIAYFTDPNCGYCRRLDQELAKMNNITVHVFLYPILSQDSRDKAAAVWCSKDRAVAYNDLMLHGKPPRAAGKCDTPIDKIVAYGQQKGINGTPTLFLSDGQRVTGAVPAERLEKLIDGAR